MLLHYPLDDTHHDPLGSGHTRDIDRREPFLIAANVRGELDLASLSIGPGLGSTGDLVLGTVFPEQGVSVRILDQQRRLHELAQPVRVLAVLGPRDSSTHVCATIPAEGVSVDRGTVLHWIAGESGIVGRLEREAPQVSPHQPESALKFVCEGLVHNAGGQVINIRDFAHPVPAAALQTPIVFIAATSSEAGKTVLAGEIIRRLNDTGLRVAAIKVTGTGGVLDSLYHQRHGADSVSDFVDAGLISTHCDAAVFRQAIPQIFRQHCVRGADVIIAELGGDLLSANNPTLFELAEILDNTLMLLAVSNDALGAVGVETINQSRLGVSPSKLRHVTSPFRNHAGMQRRLALAGITECYDPRCSDDLDLLIEQMQSDLTPAGSRVV